ncbi:CD3324 family protein [Pseudobacteroides cellulosolvens]|uniref:Mor transcription activator domain protein n=1 Tax=Pseudobacteroides cellulosolvens ATCC 35603 = DSM 2933 TaxID=398512 RepID=A0A0L6JTK2_9FIRM|nr:CD3324 family protein [Pseudobacteroides cellulosolvens]KNY28727.1 Mor transcription activator domain protein [Pseudobacteroides cellulosolvens ATCC 35603 = DSM 2933]
MSYKKAIYILPNDLLELVQKYVDGEFIYIPRKLGNKKEWGSNTSTRKELNQRNIQVYEDYLAGNSLKELSEKYFLSLKSIQRIIREQRNIN